MSILLETNDVTEIETYFFRAGICLTQILKVKSFVSTLVAVFLLKIH